MTLLEEALNYKITRNTFLITDEVIDVAFAWLKGKVTLAQCEKALYGEVGGMNCYITFSRALKQAYQEGKIKIVK